MDFRHTGSNIVTVRENNLSLVIRLIHKAKICSRADIAAETGLQQATITNIVNELIEHGLVIQTGNIKGRMNRRSIGIALNIERYRMFGVYLNRENVTIAMFDLAGSILERYDYPVERDMKPSITLDVIRQKIIQMCEQDKELIYLGIGISLPGPFLLEGGKIALMSGVPGWDEIDISARLSEGHDLPIFLEHDANCGALAEIWYGDVGRQENVVYLTVDIGVGAGVLIQGEIYHGDLGTAGEIGHMSIDYAGPICECGNRGCLELYCSTKVLRQAYKQKAFLNPAYATRANASIEQILKDVADGDSLAREVFAKTATFLGLGMVNVVNTFNPGKIVISDRIALAGDYLIQILSGVLRERVLPEVYEKLEIRVGAFIADNILFGASALVLEHVLKSPTKYFRWDEQE
jgi:Transcriptional regulator/sugar kinase